MKTLIATTALATIAALAQPAAATEPAHAGVYRFADGTRVPGAVSTLNTGAAGASFTLRTSGLPAGHTVTVWAVIFNEPQNCTHGELGLRCGPGDLPIHGGDDSAVTSVVYAAGHVIGGSGSAGYGGFLAATPRAPCSGLAWSTPPPPTSTSSSTTTGCSTPTNELRATTTSGPATPASTSSSHPTSNEGALT